MICCIRLACAISNHVYDSYCRDDLSKSIYYNNRKAKSYYMRLKEHKLISTEIIRLHVFVLNFECIIYMYMYVYIYLYI